MDQVREGALDSFSVGFRPVRSRRDAQGIINVQEAAIHEVSLCPMGAYDGARVLATRSPARGSGPLFGEMPPVDLTPVGPLRDLWP
jgi:phage head maturation protease